MAITNSMENNGKPLSVQPSTMGHYSEHMRAFSAAGGVLLGDARSQNTTHSLLSQASGMPPVPHALPQPSMGTVTAPPRLY